MNNLSACLAKQCRLPFISILMPAFSYPDGIVRILRGLNLNNTIACEVLIFDNSPDDMVELSVMNWGKTSGVDVFYVHNTPPTDPAPNWNALLDTARGEYCLLMHHDEFPMGDQFLDELIKTLREHPNTDVAILDCVLIDPLTGGNRRHLPTWFRTLVLNHFPEYLYRRNVIGPTGALVVRRSMYPRFDTRLRWLVDVDVYVRLLQVTRNVCHCPHIKIGSMLGRSDSITARLRSSIPKIAREERAYLLNSCSTSSIWLGPYPAEPIYYSLLRAIENVCWLAMRVLTRTVDRLLAGSLSRAEAQSALNVRQNK